VDVPVSIDFESATETATIRFSRTIDRLLELGVCGMIIVQ
jgi:2-methylisocitrate lyase-like PEP mutase family enzyme